MAEKAGNDESEFGSVTTSQILFLNNCPFADPPRGVEEDTDSDATEVLATPMSTPVTRTPTLSLSTPMISLDSINDEDVFRTPPENASLSSAAESEPRARVSQIKPRRGGSKSKSPPASASASLAVRNVRDLETNNRIADPEEPVADVTPLTSPPPSSAAGNVKVPGGGGGSKSKSKSPSHVYTAQPLPAETVRVLEMNLVCDPEEPVTEVTPLSSPQSLAAKRSDLDSSPPSATERIKVVESGGDDYEIEIPFKEVIEALLRNSGENLGIRDERVSYVDILKQCGLKFP